MIVQYDLLGQLVNKPRKAHRERIGSKAFGAVTAQHDARSNVLWNGIQAKAVTAAFEQLSYKEQWYLEKRNAICMTCGRVSPLSTQSTFEDLAVDFEGTTASGAEQFYRRTLDKLRLKLLESGLIHTVTLKQTECRKRNKIIAAAVYLYQADNGGEWGELRFDFESGTAEIVRLADWDTTTSNIFAKTAIRFVQGLPEARLLNSVVVPFEMDVLERPLPLTKAAKESTTTANGVNCGLTLRTAQPR